MNRYSLRNETRAFTIIELLVVVAIIGTIAALLAPSLAGAREKGRRIKCVSNLRQVSLAALSYADDNNGYLPSFFSGTIDIQGGNKFKFHTQGRWALNSNFGPLNNVNLLVCPTDNKPNAVPGLLDANGNPTTVYTSLQFNYELYLTQTRMQTVPSSQIVLAFDGNALYNLQQGHWYGNLDPGQKKSDVNRMNSGVASGRHTGKFNAVYLDQHVEWQNSLAYDSLLPDWQ